MKMKIKIIALLFLGMMNGYSQAKKTSNHQKASEGCGFKNDCQTCRRKYD